MANGNIGFRILITLTFLLIAPSASYSSDLASDENASFQGFLATVNGACKVDIPAVAAGVAQPWAVVKVTPDAFSGDLMSNEYIDGLTGKLVVPKQVIAASYETGSYDVLASLGSSVTPISGRFRWDTYDNGVDNTTPPDEITDSACSGDYPRRVTNYIICQMMNATSKRLFGNVSWIPADWVPYVAPAVVSFRKAGPQSNYKNPFLTLNQIKTLLAQRRLSTSIVRKCFAGNDLTRCSAIIELLSEGAWFDSPDNCKWLDSEISRRHCFDFSTAVIAGITNSWVYGPRDSLSESGKVSLEKSAGSDLILHSHLTKMQSSYLIYLTSDVESLPK
jgi:hypothetical protein